MAIPAVNVNTNTVHCYFVSGVDFTNHFIFIFIIVLKIILKITLSS